MFNRVRSIAISTYICLSALISCNRTSKFKRLRTFCRVRQHLGAGRSLPSPSCNCWRFGDTLWHLGKSEVASAPKTNSIHSTILTEHQIVTDRHRAIANTTLAQSRAVITKWQWQNVKSLTGNL